MAAVFSIRHYLIDRVAGLIVQGGYFRAAFVWGSAIPPPPTPSLDPQLPDSPPFTSRTLAPAEALLSCVQRRVFVQVCVRRPLSVRLVICSPSAGGRG